MTVLVPATLRAAVDGRQRLDLGVPPLAELGDVVESLFKLYPRLALHMASEKRPARPALSFFFSEQMSRDFERRRFRMREGQTLFLSAAATRRD